TPGFTCAWRRKEIGRWWNRSTWRAQVVITKSEPTGRGEEDFVSALPVSERSEVGDQTSTSENNHGSDVSLDFLSRHRVSASVGPDCCILRGCRSRTRRPSR